MTIKDLTDHWIGVPKSPYVHYTATVSSTTPTSPAPTSAPLATPKRSTKTKKRKKRKQNRKRRIDSDEMPQYRDVNNKDQYSDFDYDYDNYDNPSYNRQTSPRPYIMRSSASSPKTVYVNPSGSGSSPSVSAVYAGVPKVATYVVPSAKKYIVQRVNSHAIFVPPASDPSKMYSMASGSGMRRQDPFDYDDGASGGAHLGPQNGFPPRPVMNKITEAGGRQPCHGPECHQHHKGLVRFYWRRVVYPEGTRRGRRRPGRFRNRRRFRDGGRSPSDQKDVYAAEEDEDAEEDPEESEEENDEEEEEEDADESGESSNRRNRWRPKGYGHDLHEGSNYDDDDGRVYRDKRFAFKNQVRKRYR
ncbi:hypothetical protein JTE90_013780 [Oedothorax gibbosus]|uniref:Uncharacterized protein n=1 Tax=Oedothorax gibbosus TaxID=931172 RepID=A0AAV6UXW9_9ARAC|nr:hypothetical protein JTE90_013780 [Oedothorax gibbosus]